MQDCGSVMQGCAYASAYVILFATKVWSCKLYGDMQIHGEEQIHSHWVCCFPLFFYVVNSSWNFRGWWTLFFLFHLSLHLFSSSFNLFFLPLFVYSSFWRASGLANRSRLPTAQNRRLLFVLFFLFRVFLSYSCFRIVNNWVYVELWWSGRDMPCVCYAWFLLFPLFFYSMPLI